MRREAALEALLTLSLAQFILVVCGGAYLAHGLAIFVLVLALRARLAHTVVRARLVLASDASAAGAILRLRRRGVLCLARRARRDACTYTVVVLARGLELVMSLIIAICVSRALAIMVRTRRLGLPL